MFAVIISTCLDDYERVLMFVVIETLGDLGGDINHINLGGETLGDINRVEYIEFPVNSNI